MTSILVQHQVEDFVAWKEVFDSAAAMRTSFDEISTQIFRDVSDPNKLTVVNKWDSLANKQKFVHSPELLASMKKAGVVGQPNVHFLNEE
jgi:hypothetical protein